MKIETHCFPDLKNALQSSSGGEDKCSPFQPLYPNASSPSSRQIWNNPADDSDSLFEQERQKWFQNGLEAGRAEGTRLARETLAAPLARFFNTYNRLATQNLQIAEIAGSHAVRLALALVERILGPDIHLSMDDLAPLSSLLQEATNKKNSLIIHLHPDELQQLRDIAEHNGQSWPASSREVGLESDSSVAAGSLQTDQQAGGFQTMIGQAADSLSKILSASHDAP